MRLVFAGQLPKDSGDPDHIEDAFVLDLEAGLVALSDGASVSFDSRTWARVLVDRYVADPHVGRAWLAAAAREYGERWAGRELSWSQEASFAEGSYATLLGLRHVADEGRVEVVCVGDTLAVLVDGAGRRRRSTAYRRAETFRERPVLLATNPARNRPVLEPGFIGEHTVSWPVDSRGPWHVLCMTDALAAWALDRDERGRPAWHELLALRDADGLEDIVTRERGARAMRTDDVTLVHLEFEGTDGGGLPDA